MYDASIGRWFTVDPLAGARMWVSPYNFVQNNPLSRVDPDGMLDIRIHGTNNSSVTIVTDLIDIDLNASGLGLDFGGNHTLEGSDLLEAAFDIGGMIDQTGAVDAAASLYHGSRGDYGNSLISGLSVLPGGDLLKLGKVGKHFKTISNAIDGINSADKAKDVKKATGSYTIIFENGKKYHGKGPESRMNKSANDKATKDNPVKSKDWTPADNDREAFKQESRRLEDDGGHRSNTNYNKRDSPGTKYRKQDGDK
jgi:hypothetical protein